jgi:hypothetical protein
MPKLNNITVTNKILGRGMQGSVYEAIDSKNNKYALKIEPVFKKNIEQSYSSSLWREIDFAETMGTLYPNHFMKLYDYKIDDKCNYINSFKDLSLTLDDLPIEQQKYYKKLYASTYCSIKLWSKIDMTLDQLLNSWKKFKKVVFNDLLIQIIYIIYLINTHGYFHHDFHTHNIGIVRTNKKHITIFGKKILTHGYLVQAIDFGLVLHGKYKLKKWEQTALKYDNDLFMLIFLLFKLYMQNLISLKGDDELHNEITINSVDQEKINYYLSNKLFDKTKWGTKNKIFFSQILYKVLFFDKYIKSLTDEPIELFDFMPLNKFEYIMYNIYDIPKILNFLIDT